MEHKQRVMWKEGAVEEADGLGFYLLFLDPAWSSNGYIKVAKTAFSHLQKDTHLHRTSFFYLKYYSMFFFKVFYLEITSTSPSVCACLFMALSRQRGRRSCKHSHKHTCVCVGVYYGCTPADQEDHNKMSVNSVILENKISQISCDSVVCVCVCMCMCVLHSCGTFLLCAVRHKL